MMMYNIYYIYIYIYVTAAVVGGATPISLVAQAGSRARVTVVATRVVGNGNG